MRKGKNISISPMLTITYADISLDFSEILISDNAYFIPINYKYHGLIFKKENLSSLLIEKKSKLNEEISEIISLMTKNNSEYLLLVEG